MDKKETNKYQITNRNTRVCLSIFEADSEASALDAMSQDAGYADFAESCEVIQDDSSDLIVRVVSELNL